MKINQKLLDLLKSNNFHSLSTNVIAAIFGFLSILILARRMPSQEEFGVWMIYLTASGFIEMFRFSFCKLGIVRFLAGAEEKDKKHYIGSNWIIGLLLTIFILVIFFLIRILFNNVVIESDFHLFILWYPLLAVVNLSYNNALSILQAEMRFKDMLILKTINIVSFFVFVLVYALSTKPYVETIILGQIFVNLIVSLIAIIYGWDGVRYVFKYKIEKVKELLNFGFYSVGSIISTNLLKSSDTFLIALSPLGAEAVAIYSIPLKLIEIIEIPLRSFTATSYPQMSKESIRNRLDNVKALFYKYSGLLTILIIPLLIIIFVFAENLVVLVGGAEYIESANILRVFAIYGLFLPIDRYTGVTLDSINQPKLNMIKVLIMVIVNIVGDIIVLSIWQSLLPVAVVTILTVNVGMILGFFFLKKHIDIRFLHILKSGWNYTSAYINKTKILLNNSSND